MSCFCKGWRRLARRMVAACMFVACMLVAASVRAQDVETLGRYLADSTDFRVRVQAALALGNSVRPAAIGYLTRSASDPNPAVRAAIAASLGRFGSTQGLPALRLLAQDRHPTVRRQADRAMQIIEQRQRHEAVATTGPVGPRGIEYPPAQSEPTAVPDDWTGVRYVVTLGELRDRSGFDRDSNHALGLLRGELIRGFGAVAGVAVMASPASIDGRAREQMRRRGLPDLRIDAVLVSATRIRQAGQVTIRCQVSLLVLERSGQLLLGELHGAAASTDDYRRGVDQPRYLLERAMTAAVRSALSDVSDVLVRVSGR